MLVKSFMWRALRTVVFVYVAVGLFGWFLSDSMIFLPPSVATYKNSEDILHIPVGEHDSIAAYYLRNEDATHTILYSHGNAGDLGVLKDLIYNFYEHGYSVLAYDYRGYGHSTGSPSEPNVYEDAKIAYDYLVQELKVTPKKIISYGHSLGAAVATDLALNNKVGGLVLESPFVSAFRVRTIYPLYPFDKFSNIKKLPQIQVPLLIMHSKDDHIIPFWHSELLFATANNPKTSFWVTGAGHDGITHLGKLFWNTLDDFIYNLWSIQTSLEPYNLTSVTIESGS